MGRPRKPEEKVNLGASVPIRFKDSAVKDARKFRKHLDGVVEVALQYFYGAVPESERAKLYQRLPTKVFGRPL